MGKEWQCTSAMSARRRLRLEDPEFKANLSYMAKLFSCPRCFKNHSFKGNMNCYDPKETEDP